MLALCDANKCSTPGTLVCPYTLGDVKKRKSHEKSYSLGGKLLPSHCRSLQASKREINCVIRSCEGEKGKPGAYMQAWRPRRLARSETKR